MLTVRVFSFLVQSILCFVSFLYIHRHRFLSVRKVFFSLFFIPVSWCSTPSSVPINLMFSLFTVSQIFCMFCIKNLLDLMFLEQWIYFLCRIFYTWNSLVHLLHSIGYACIYSSYSFVQIFSISRIPLASVLFLFLIASVWIFKSWAVSFTHLIIFSWTFFKVFIDIFHFFCLFLDFSKKISHFFLMTSIMLIKLFLRFFFSYTSSALGYSGVAIVEGPGSGDVILVLTLRNVLMLPSTCAQSLHQLSHPPAPLCLYLWKCSLGILTQFFHRILLYYGIWIYLQWNNCHSQANWYIYYFIVTFLCIYGMQT